jgi:hypothetical protein
MPLNRSIVDHCCELEPLANFYFGFHRSWI